MDLTIRINFGLGLLALPKIAFFGNPINRARAAKKGKSGCLPT
jgi:hypothetical protein